MRRPRSRATRPPTNSFVRSGENVPRGDALRFLELTVQSSCRYCRLHAIFMNQSCIHLGIALGIVKHGSTIGRVLKRTGGPYFEESQLISSAETHHHCLVRVMTGGDSKLDVSHRRQILSLRVSFVCHPAGGRLRRARLCAAQLSRPFFFVSLRSVRVPPSLVQLDLFRSWA